MQNEPFNRYSFLLDRTARRVKQYAQYSFTQMGFDITIDQWTILKNLWEKQGQSQRELAELCGKDQPTLTRIVDLLVKKKLAVRKSHPNDRRSFMVCLTPLGERKVEELSPKVNLIRAQAWKNLGQEDFDRMEHILNTIYDNLSI